MGVAGSSGMAVVSGVIFTAPLLQVLHLSYAQQYVDDGYNGTSPDLKAVPWASEGRALVDEYYIDDAGNKLFPHLTFGKAVVMMLFCAAGSFIGYGFVGISTKKFLSDPTLPAPEAHACCTMVRASAASAAEQPDMRRSLVASSLTSFMLPLFGTIGLMANYLTLFTHTFVTKTAEGLSARTFAVVMPCSPVYIGIGGLLTLSTATVTVAGAFTRLCGDAMVAPLSGEAAAQFPPSSMRWIGGGAMTVGVVFSLVKFMSPRIAGDGDNGDESLLDIPAKTMCILYSCVLGGIGLLAAGIWFVDRSDPWYALVMILTIFIMASFMVTLGAILSLQIGSSASPVSGTVFVTTLVVCLTSLAYMDNSSSSVSPLQAVTGISYMLITACVAVSAANDASQDYKTLQLGGIPPRDGFLGQICGLLVGALIVPISYYIAHNAYGLGTSELPAPQGDLFAIIIKGILIERVIPWTPVIIGLVIGCIAVAIEVSASRRGQQLPAMAFAVGLYLPPQLGLGILLGAGSRYFGEKHHEEDTGRKERTYESILAAAGMITGAAFLDLIVGILVIAGVSTEAMEFVSFKGDLKVGLGVVSLFLLGYILYSNARYGIPEATDDPSGLSASEGDDNFRKDDSHEVF